MVSLFQVGIILRFNFLFSTSSNTFRIAKLKYKIMKFIF